MSAPSDQSDRRRFAEELETNFSVIASAGSGKTRAITDRILEIARARDAVEILPHLVVVTFTNRAADEMQQRTRQLILADGLPAEVVSAFNRAFFGTIHAFCMKLLTNYGHYLGLPTPLELITDDDNLWQEFVQQQTRLGANLSKENRAALFRLAQARDIMELARRAGSALLRPGEIGMCPKVDFSEVHAVPAKGSGAGNISNSKAELADWEGKYNADWEFLRWPICLTTAKEFAARWRDAFGPLRKWVNETALCVAAEVQRDYRDFRLERGVVTYADQIALADELLQQPTAARRVREQNFRVILDEAQDTDPAQFSVLLEVTRPPEATGRWLETHADPPRTGHFCMVGDLQQSIYGERADLKNYRAVHDSLVESGAATPLTFSVTFRLDQGQIDFINRIFSEILNDVDGQVPFVELQPRPDVLPGQVIRFALEPDSLKPGVKLKDYQKAKIEAVQLAHWIKETGFEKLRAASWRDVAILCPRKAWLRTMAAELRRIDVPVAMQSESATKADSPAHAWLTALSTIMVDPLNSYEIVGVLREVFGISDHDLAVFADNADERRFRIDEPQSAAGIVSSRLRALAETRQRLQGTALFDAVTTLVRETQLRERLTALPTEEFGDLTPELDALLASAAEAEANGATLAEFAEKLRTDFETPREVHLSAEDGIHLITSQKAKGSEWQAVIVPFLGRDIRTPPPRYPTLLKTPGSGEIIVALSKEDPPPELKEARELSQRQEMERLLYVATTRARHTLVLAVDRELFVDVKGKLSPRAQLTRLQGDTGGKHFEQFLTLPDAPEACAETSAETLQLREETPEPPTFPPLDQKALKKAKTRASDFVRKFNPSAYDAAIVSAADNEPVAIPLPTASARSAADSPATLYGRWWHSLFEAVSWSAGFEAAERLFHERQSSSPDKLRSAAEWKFIRKLFGEPTIARLVARASAHAHAEFPFAWSSNALTAVEGVIDFLFIDEEAGKCLLLDWKTNRIKKGAEEKLRAHYRPQIAAYWKAIQEITGLDVEAGLYSTATGNLLMFATNDLETEWSRLAQLPPDQLRVEMVPDEADLSPPP